MRRDDVKDDLRELAFEFFFWFSRFESALKERGFLKSAQAGARAEPNWDLFVSRNRASYKPIAAANALIEAKPQRQIIGENGRLVFEEVLLSSGIADLDRVVALAKTVRNNLFHGGKHGSAYWDHPDRMRHLLSITIEVLKDLAQQGGLEGDFTGYY